MNIYSYNTAISIQKGGSSSVPHLMKTGRRVLERRHMEQEYVKKNVWLILSFGLAPRTWRAQKETCRDTWKRHVVRDVWGRLTMIVVPLICTFTLLLLFQNFLAPFAHFQWFPARRRLRLSDLSRLIFWSTLLNWAFPHKGMKNFGFLIGKLVSFLLFDLYEHHSNIVLSHQGDALSLHIG